jgi:DNA-binding HxlR family transcriptional regulator
MKITQTVAQILNSHVTLELECIDRMYLNLYVPGLQHVNGVVGFLRNHRKQPIASTALIAPISKKFVAAIEKYVDDNKVPVVEFRKGQRKDEIAKQYLAAFNRVEGIVFMGKAQEKASVFRTEKRRNPQTAQSYPWIVRSTAMVNHYYVYGVDEDFGPFFLKFCSYFPYNAKLYFNGHEYAKRQMAQKKIAYEALDNGVQSCGDVRALQTICDGLSAERIDRFCRKWLRLLPHPFPASDRKAGYRYALSILQAEFSLTQVLDRPVAGRQFFEEVIRENIDLGRPDHVQLLFDRKVIRTTPGLFRTRVITEGVTPSLHVQYKNTRIKQYHKEGRALRTETTINDSRDFEIGKRIHNLPALREVGFHANRRLLDTERISHDCMLAEETFQKLNRPVDIQGQRASALRFADSKVQAIWNALLIFRLLPKGFANAQLRRHFSELLGKSPDQITPGAMTYQLRRLRLHGLIQRIPKTHRYEVTDLGFRAGLFFSKVYSRILRPGIAFTQPHIVAADSKLRRAFNAVNLEVQSWIENAKLSAA